MYSLALQKTAWLSSRAWLSWVLMGRQQSCTYWSQISRCTVALNEEINPSAWHLGLATAKLFLQKVIAILHNC